MTDKYVNKRREVEARQLTASNVDELARWCAGERREEADPFVPSKKFAAINMPTLAGVERVQEGDYIVRHPSGTFTKMSRFAFENEYEHNRPIELEFDSSEKTISGEDVRENFDPRERWRTV